MYIFFYKTINKINGHYYFGIHKAAELDDGYVGGGVYSQNGARNKSALHKAIREYKYFNFKMETIKTFSTYEEAAAFEKQYITEEMLKDPTCYNMKPGGKGGGRKWSEERKQFHKIKGTYKHSLQRKEKLRKASIERFKYEPGTFSGKKHTRKTKLKLRKINKGKIQSLETVQKRSKSMQTLHLRRPVEWIQKQKEHLRHIVQLQQEKFLKEFLELSERVKKEYTGKRGQKVILAKKFSVSIDKITKIVGKSYLHRKYSKVY